ncbi:MAG: hypothetical protein R6V44_17785 [Paracoccaceae bacterium]
MTRQGLRNLMVLAALPWAAGFAVAAEFAALARGRWEALSPWR